MASDASQSSNNNRAYLPSWVEEDVEVAYCLARCPMCDWSERFGLAESSLDAALGHGETGHFPGCWESKAFAVFTDGSEVQIW